MISSLADRKRASKIYSYSFEWCACVILLKFTTSSPHWLLRWNVVGAVCYKIVHILFSFFQQIACCINDSEKMKLFLWYFKNIYRLDTSVSATGLSSFASRSTVTLKFNIKTNWKAILNLSHREVPGTDEISNKIFGQLLLVTRRINLFICNAILRMQYYSSEWKLPMITLIPKPENTPLSRILQDYILPTISKLFEPLPNPVFNNVGCNLNYELGFRPHKHSSGYESSSSTSKIHVTNPLFNLSFWYANISTYS